MICRPLPVPPQKKVHRFRMQQHCPACAAWPEETRSNGHDRALRVSDGFRKIPGMNYRNNLLHLQLCHSLLPRGQEKS